MPKSLGARGAGNFNLKGKKTHLCECRCCVVQDFREAYEARRVANEEMNIDIRSMYRDYVPADNPKEHAGLPDSDYDLVDTKPWDTEDRGTWEVITSSIHGVALVSSDFKFDVQFNIYGDFPSDEARVEYAMRLADRLNRTIPE